MNLLKLLISCLGGLRELTVLKINAATGSSRPGSVERRQIDAHAEIAAVGSWW